MVQFIKNFIATSVSDSDKTEFVISICKINVFRARITAVVFAVLEIMMLLFHSLSHRENLSQVPYLYYGYMYILMLAAMIAFFVIFTKLGADVEKHLSSIRCAGILFIGFILIWCAGISLLDQLTSGQVIVYVVAVIFIAITPFFEPVTLLLVYLTVHALFLLAMPCFQQSSQLILENSLNSTTFVIMAWAISCMRCKKQAEDFNMRTIILQKNDELSLMNLQLQEANQKLEIMSMTDGLTGVINRLSFETIMQDEWNRCKRHAIPLSLIMADIDFFKEFNDHYGHQAGDRCIRQIAEVLTGCARRSSDKVARYGGDEFAVILPHTDKDDALNLADQIRKGVEEKAVPHSLSRVSDRVTISLGINSVIPSDETSIDEFIRSTDKALYLAKQRRNCAVFAAQQ